MATLVFIIRWLPCLCWCACIYWVSDQSSVNFPLAFPHADKLMHLGAYGVLGALVVVGIGFEVGGVVLVAGCLGALYGITDEWHQFYVPGREADWLDWCADCLGSFWGAASLRYIVSKRYE